MMGTLLYYPYVVVRPDDPGARALRVIDGGKNERGKGDPDGA